MPSYPPTHIFFSNDEYEIRPAKNSSEYKKLWWSFMQQLQWDRCYYDLETYMDSSNASGMILLIDKVKNEPVGHVAVVVNDNRTAWVSMFIIDAPHRGKGMGAELFRAAVQDAQHSGVEIMGLDGVPEQRKTYERRTFVESSLGTITMVGRSLDAKSPLPSTKLPEGTFLLDIGKVPVQLLVEHELKYTGFERSKLWSKQHLFHRQDILGVALTSSVPPNSVDDILGWSVVRRCSNGARIGPVYATNVDIARTILAEATKLATSKYIKDIPLPNEPLSDLSEEEIVDKATVVAEVWTGQPSSLALFQELGFTVLASFHRMWANNKATQQQESVGGIAQKGVFAIFDAAIG